MASTNHRSNWRFARRRAAVRAGFDPALRWKDPLVFGLSGVFVCLLVLDHPIGLARGGYDGLAAALGFALTDAGKSGWILIPTGVFALLTLFIDRDGMNRRQKLFLANWTAVAAFIFAAVGLSGLVATLLKRIIGRARPEEMADVGMLAFEHFAIDASFASFPSGHATTTGALAMALALLYPSMRRLIIPLAMLIASTRIVVGAHYVSDVVAGLMFGAWFGYFTATVFARHGLIFRLQPARLPARKPGFQLMRPERFRVSLARTFEALGHDMNVLGGAVVVSMGRLRLSRPGAE